MRVGFLTFWDTSFPKVTDTQQDSLPTNPAVLWGRDNSHISPKRNLSRMQPPSCSFRKVCCLLYVVCTKESPQFAAGTLLCLNSGYRGFDVLDYKHARGILRREGVGVDVTK